MSQDESLNIALPASMQEFVRAQVSAGGYDSASEYVRELIRADQQRKAAEQLDDLLIAGLEGPFEPMTRGDWDSLRNEVRERRTDAS